MTEVLIVLGVLVAVAAIVVVALGRRRTGPAGSRAKAPPDVSRVALDIEPPDPEAPAVQRLVLDAAAQALRSHPDLEHVEVTTRSGKLLRRVERHVTAGPAGVVPPELAEPHRPSTHAPDPSGHLEGEREVSAALPHYAERAESGAHSTLADAFDLPQAVRARISDPDQAIGLVRAILEAGGVDVTVDGDVLRAGDQVVVVLPYALGKVVSAEDLNNAYMRFTQSRARRGVVVTPGLMSPVDLRRRHSMAPALLHAGPDGIQRMADAVALGADPLRFATGTALAEG